MKETIYEILNNIDEDILAYEGDNLLEDGIVDSFTIMEIITDIESKLKVEISPEEVTEEHFKTVDSLIGFIGSLK